MGFFSFAKIGAAAIVSDRSFGSVNPLRDTGAGERVAGLLNQAGLPILPERVVFAEQTHGCEYRVCGFEYGGKIVSDTDVLMTSETGLALAMRTADCVPALFYDPVNRAIAAAHAGRRGLLNGVITKTVAAMESEFRTRPENLFVGIGPFIHQCCYEVKDDVIRDAENAGYDSFLYRDDGQTALDLEGILYDQLKAVGVLAPHIEDMKVCTSCNSDKYFSFRRRIADEEPSSLFASVIVLE